jgi:hypothetical protein
MRRRAPLRLMVMYGLPSTFNFDGLLRVPPNVRDGLICWKFLKTCIEAGLRACRAKVVAAWSIFPSAKARIRKEDEREMARANCMRFVT